MKPSVLRSSLVAAFAFSLVACASKDEDTTEGPPAPVDECDPNATINCFEGKAEPCKDFNSGFKGDEFCLEPPDPSVGYQLHVGPSDYDDPADTDRYMIQPGDETNWAEIKETPNDVVAFTGGYYSRMRPGSHHFILFGLNERPAGSTGPMMNASGIESAVGGLGGTFLGGATRAVQNVDTQSDYPEDQGYGTEVPPHRPIAVNLHFINTENEPLLQEIWVNFMTMAEDEISHWVKPITWYGGLQMAIAPGTDVLLQNDPNGCTSPGDRRIMGMSGHVHASTLRITTTLERASGETALLFEDYDWHEPTEWRFTRAVDNGTPDPLSKRSGGYTGVMNVSAGDKFGWECEVQNRRDVTLTFSNRVYDGEMCNVFGFYASPDRNGAPWLCAFF